MKRLRLFLLLSLFVLVMPVSAHGYIVRAVPEDRTVLDRAPVRVQYWFSESLEPDPQFSSLNVRDQNGEIIATGGVDPDNYALMTVRLPPDLSDGAYIVEIRSAFASDGHVVTESRVFFVGQEVGEFAGQAANTQAIPLEVFWRALMLSSSMLLFGVFTLYALVLSPAWGSATHAAGHLPPRVMNRLYWIAGIAFVLVFAANLIALLQQSMAFFGTGLAPIIQQNLWQVVRIGSRFGDVWNARLLFLIIAAAMFATSLYYRRSQPEMVRPFWIANAWLMPLIMGTFSATSHAAGSLMQPWIGVTFDWLHTIAVALWIGSLMALVLVLPSALQPYSGEQRRMGLLAVLSRFSRLAYGAAAVVISTGVYNSLTWFSRPADVATPFGAALAFKTLLVVLLLLIAAAHHVALNPQRFVRFAGIGKRVGDFTRSLHLEAVLAVAVLTAAGLLTATPVPVPELEQVDAPRAEQTVGDTTIALTVTPGGPGINTYDAVFTRDGQLVEGLEVRLQAVSPSRDSRAPRQTLEAADAGLYVNAAPDFDRAGDWLTLVDFTDQTGTTQRAVFEWAISEEAAVIQSRDPNVLNILAFLGVIGAVIFALMPLIRRIYVRLDLNPVNVTIAISAVVVTIVLLAVAGWYVQQSQRQYEETLNPPPQVVNTVLPDMASLERGRALYEANCGWSDEALNALVSRLPRTRDEELFRFTTTGWGDLPACDAGLTNPQRWDIVNFIRTLEG